jgi:hypothetical protein
MAPKTSENGRKCRRSNYYKLVKRGLTKLKRMRQYLKATDKVDSEVPSEVSGILVEQLFAKDDLVLVGQTIAIIETEGGEMVAVVKSAASQEAVTEVTKQLTLLKIVLQLS